MELGEVFRLGEDAGGREFRRVLARFAPLFAAGILTWLAGCRGVPVTVRVEGDGLAVPGQALLAVAHGSPPGGSCQWERLFPDADHRIVAARKNWVMVVSDKCGLPFFRVTYRRRGHSAIAYFTPYVVDMEFVAAGSWHPDTPEEIKARRRRKRLHDEYVARMRAPEGIEDLRKAIRIGYLGSGEAPEPYTQERYGFGLSTPAGTTAAVMTEVGPVAAREIHKMMPEAGQARARMIAAIVRIDPDYALANVLPELMTRDDLRNVDILLGALWPYSQKNQAEASSEAIAGLRLAMDSPEPYIRMAVCKCIGDRRIAGAKELVATASQSDPHPLVRGFAHIALQCLIPEISRFFATSGTAPPWPELCGIVFEPAPPDPKEVKRARRLYPKVRREIETKLDFEYDLPHDAALKTTQFQLYGWAVMPIIQERLAASDCSEKERRALELMRCALRTAKDAP